MERENVLEIEFIPIWDNNFVWKIIKQNEDVLKIGEFEDSDLFIVSCGRVGYDKECNLLYLKGKITENDYNLGIYNFCTLEEKKLIEEKVKAINEKYEIKKRWRAKYGNSYCYIDRTFQVSWDLEKNHFVDNKKYENGNYFETEKEALEYAEYMTKCSLGWHEKRDIGNIYENKNLLEENK
jgi:hypothetical protein F3_00887